MRNIGENIGDALTLETPTGPVSVRIVGTIPTFLSSRGTVLMSRTLYREKWRDDHLTHALLRLAPGANVDTVRSQVERSLASRYSVRVLRTGELVEWMADQARHAFRSLDVLAALGVVVVLVGVGDALAANALERTREFGVLRAMGIPRRSLRNIVLTEALLLGTFGMVTALVVGTALGVLWVEVTFPALVGWTLSLYFPFPHAILIPCAVIAICMIAAYAPAAHAARLDPIVALRTD